MGKKFGKSQNNPYICRRSLNLFFCMQQPIVNIHTHSPREHEITPRIEGIHPWEAELWSGTLPPLSPACEAVGEIGLDRSHELSAAPQEALFEAQLSQAEMSSLPVILHSVKAFEPVMEALAHHSLQGVIFHGFIGSTQQVERAVKAGYYLSFGAGALRSPRTVDVIRSLPDDRLFLETDCSPFPIEELYREVAVLRGTTPEALMTVTRANFRKLFRR